jgi:hypothetical protein
MGEINYTDRPKSMWKCYSCGWKGRLYYNGRCIKCGSISIVKLEGMCSTWVRIKRFILPRGWEGLPDFIFHHTMFKFRRWNIHRLEKKLGFRDK